MKSDVEGKWASRVSSIILLVILVMAIVALLSSAVR